MLYNGINDFKPPYRFSSSPLESLPTPTTLTDDTSQLPLYPAKSIFDLPLNLDDQNNPNATKKNLFSSLAVIELLKTGCYEQAAELLQQAQLAGYWASDAAEMNFLVVAQQICQACSQYRAEIAWHRQALEAVSQREQELSQQLYALLTLANGHQPEANLVSPGSILPQPQKKPSAPVLEINSLGSFQICLNGQPLNGWSSLKARAIFKYLVMQSGAVSKDILMDTFWPEADPDAARHNLHQAIHSLRKTWQRACPDLPLILFEHDSYLLNPVLSIHRDFVEFEYHVQAGQRLEAKGQMVEAVEEYQVAVELYRGDFLEEDLYEDWPQARREHLRQVYLKLVDQLSEYHFQQGNCSETITLCQKLLSLDNCYEEAHRRLMRCYQSQGQRRRAVRQYQLCVQALKKELDVPPLPETERLYEAIISG